MEGLTYILPIRARSLCGADELAVYLRGLAREMPVIVVDGSEPGIFAAHAQLWADCVRHVPPAPAIGGANGKARGVLTGLRAVTTDKAIIADDDVRYAGSALRAVCAALDEADVVRPQNFFAPHAWHTILDTARSLLNRVSGGDWPGTLGVRCALLADGYDADVLFENLELVRTVRARGGRELVAYDIYVARRPPTTKHFLAQRVRQAYDEFARPLRLGIALAIVPAAVMAYLRDPRILLGCAVGIVAAAEAGRRRAGGSAYFPLGASVAAPLWLLERGVCAWLAVALRVGCGGVPYAGIILKKAATPNFELRARAA